MDQIETQIAESLAELHGRWYGRGPSSATAYMARDVIVVTMEETFTPAEQELMKRDMADGIQETRRRFQTVMADEFKSIVVQATGRTVRSFVSDTDLKEGIALETFVLGGVLEDMESFEHAGEADDPEQR